MKNREPDTAPRILIADDSNVAQRMGKEILVAEGYNVLTVSNGQAAIKKLKEFLPDLILADIFMPGANGFEVCQFVRADAELGYVPVILLVGAMEPYDEEEARRAKADAVITKPLHSTNLVGVVKDLLKSVKSASLNARASRSAAAREPAPVEPPLEPSLDDGDGGFVDESSGVAFESAAIGQPVVPELSEPPDAVHSPFEMELEAEQSVAEPSEAFHPAPPLASTVEAVEDDVFSHSEVASPFPFVSSPDEGEAQSNDPPMSFPFSLSPDVEENPSEGTGAIESVPLEKDLPPDTSPLEPSFAVSPTLTGENGFAREASDHLATHFTATALQEPVIAPEPPSEKFPWSVEEEPAVAEDSAPPLVWIAEQVEVTEEDRKLFEAAFPDWEVLTNLVQADVAATMDADTDATPKVAAQALPESAVAQTEMAESAAPADSIASTWSEPIRAESDLTIDSSVEGSESPIATETAETTQQPDAPAAQASALEPEQAEESVPEMLSPSGEMEQEIGDDIERESEPFPLSPPPAQYREEPAEPRIIVDRAFIEQLVRDSVESVMPEMVDRIMRSVEAALERAEQ